ncbi:MAG: acetyltransferase [Chloroflexi bacterium]|jgi:sugar O-acyltransferase (sialic acid O-acetyltransferase NeuD family)|nr:acetyltransferase [Chloroflexota bacterium]
MTQRIVILGAGGHARVVCEALQLSGYEVVGFLDDNPTLAGTTALGLPVLGPIDLAASLAVDGAIVGIGENHVRARLYARLQAWGIPLVRAVHPSAIISTHAALGEGVAVLERAVIEAGARIGANAIINAGAIVPHDCCIGEHAHVAIGGMLAGGVEIGEGCFLGAGAIVIPYKKVGEWSIVGAGAVVTADLPAHVTAVGVPARVIKRHEEA